MHRRQYLPRNLDRERNSRPHAQLVSLRKENRSLRECLRAEEQSRLGKADKASKDTGIRSFIGKVKRVLNAPIHLPKWGKP